MPKCMIDVLKLLLFIVYYCNVRLSPEEKFVRCWFCLPSRDMLFYVLIAFCLGAAAEQGEISPATKLFVDEGR